MRAGIFLLLSILSASCARETAVEGEKPVTHEEFAHQLHETGLGQTAMGQRWMRSARDALANPMAIVPPYAESGGFVAHRAGALGLLFDAYDGQTLNLQFDRRDESDGMVFVELFHVSDRNGERRHVLLRAMEPEESAVRMTVPYDGEYLLRLQPELLVDTLYDLRIELDAAIRFPIQDGAAGVGSYFGDPRDAGSRQHEGIDIFMPRHTPVIAVASGRAVARTTPRGGNVVWLRTKRQSYYYAHLEKTAFSGARRVQDGEILGYVGNSGNAKTTPPHLHFGVYRRGQGAIDPMPRLSERLFGEQVPTVQFEPRYVRTQAASLNLRAAPATSADVLGQLAAGSLVQASAMRGEWLRVQTVENGSGWIHSSYQEDSALAERWQPQKPGWLLDGVAADARPVAVIGTSDEFEVMGRHGGHMLVRSPDGTKAGWVEDPAPEEETAGAAVVAEGAGEGSEPEESEVASGAGS